MCEICGQNPCHPRCPNALEPKEVHICSECLEGIYPGDRFYESCGSYVCEECLKGMRYIQEPVPTAQGSSCRSAPCGTGRMPGCGLPIWPVGSVSATGTSRLVLLSLEDEDQS